MLNKKCMLLFVRIPERGSVKSRLAKDLSEDTVLSLYENFVFDILDTLEKGEYPLIICFSPPHKKEEISNWLGESHSYMPQRGKHLGGRMKNAFIEAFSNGFSDGLLIGSDIPDITKSFIDEAFDLTQHDAVIGPSADGGYYLIGFKIGTFLPQIFENIRWGTDTVFEDTMKIFYQYKYEVHILPVWRDVDRLDDVKELFERNLNTEFANSRTMNFIRNKIEVIFGEKKSPFRNLRINSKSSLP